MPKSSDLVYSYDFERTVKCIETEAMFKASGIDAIQTIEKKSSGNAVIIQGNSFIEPETQILISIDTNGKVFSPENPTIQEKYSKNEKLIFQGLYEENSQIFHIEINAILKPLGKENRADETFNGEFEIVDSGTEKILNVMIKDGLYFWQFKNCKD